MFFYFYMWVTLWTSSLLFKYHGEGLKPVMLSGSYENVAAQSFTLQPYDKQYIRHLSNTATLPVVISHVPHKTSPSPGFSLIFRLLQIPVFLFLLVSFSSWLYKELYPGKYIPYHSRWFPAVLFPPRLHSSHPEVVGRLLFNSRGLQHSLTKCSLSIFYFRFLTIYWAILEIWWVPKFFMVLTSHCWCFPVGCARTLVPWCTLLVNQYMREHGYARGVLP